MPAREQSQKRDDPLQGAEGHAAYGSWEQGHKMGRMVEECRTRGSHKRRRWKEVPGAREAEVLDGSCMRRDQSRPWYELDRAIFVDQRLDHIHRSTMMGARVLPMPS